LFACARNKGRNYDPYIYARPVFALRLSRAPSPGCPEREDNFRHPESGSGASRKGGCRGHWARIYPIIVYLGVQLEGHIKKEGLRKGGCLLGFLIFLCARPCAGTLLPHPGARQNPPPRLTYRGFQSFSFTIKKGERSVTCSIRILLAPRDCRCIRAHRGMGR